MVIRNGCCLIGKNSGHPNITTVQRDWWRSCKSGSAVDRLSLSLLSLGLFWYHCPVDYQQKGFASRTERRNKRGDVLRKYNKISCSRKKRWWLWMRVGEEEDEEKPNGEWGDRRMRMKRRDEEIGETRSFSSPTGIRDRVDVNERQRKRRREKNRKKMGLVSLPNKQISKRLIVFPLPFFFSMYIYPWGWRSHLQFPHPFCLREWGTVRVSANPIPFFWFQIERSFFNSSSKSSDRFYCSFFVYAFHLIIRWSSVCQSTSRSSDRMFDAETFWSGHVFDGMEYRTALCLLVLEPSCNHRQLFPPHIEREMQFDSLFSHKGADH